MPDTNLKGRTVYLVDGNRTPFLKAQNKLGPFSASTLAVHASRSLMQRLPISASDIDEVILGCAMPSVDEANIARLLSLRLGCKQTTPAWTVMRNCASGLQSIDNAAQSIAMGRSEIVLAGGTEAMSRAPLLLNAKMANWLGGWFAQKTMGGKVQLLSKLRPAFFVPVIALLRGLTDPFIAQNMGQTAENLAFRFSITREDMDAFALASHQKLSNSDYLSDEITPLIDDRGNVYDTDTGARADSSMEKLAKLRPFFDKKYGMVTAGNSSQVTDGACMMILASEEAVKTHKLPVMGVIKDIEWAALEPEHMGLGPVHAATPLLQRHKLKLDDLDAVEINEAFAAQVIACQKAWEDESYCREALGLDGPFGHLASEKLNQDGGAIACGHPIGASGARIVLHLAQTLKHQSKKTGLASICIGGGQGGALLMERTEDSK